MQSTPAIVPFTVPLHGGALERFTDRVQRCASIVYKRLRDLSNLSENNNVPILQNDEMRVRVWSLGAPKGGHANGASRFVAETILDLPENSSWSQKIREAFTERRSEWDTSRHVSSGTIRQVAAGNCEKTLSRFSCELVRAATNSVCGGLISPREFLCAEAYWVGESSSFCCGFSLDDRTDPEARLEPTPGFVRGTAHPSGWLFERLQGNQYLFRYTIHADPGGILPMSIVNETTPAELLHLMSNFVKYIATRTES